MPARPVCDTPATSCPNCLSWGASYGLRSYCRACYDFTRRYHCGECATCWRIIAVKNGHCRLCWLQAGIAAAGRRGITPAALPGPERHPHGRDPGTRWAPARRPGPFLHLAYAGTARGPRSRPRNTDSVRMNLNPVHPLLLQWAGQYVHLREVTAADVIAW